MTQESIFKQKLEQIHPLILDGGLATELEANGYDLNTSLWSAALLQNQPQAIMHAHLAYLHAGAQIITTATYQASMPGFKSMGLTTLQSESLMLDAIELAQKAVAQYKQEQPGSPLALIAASIGPYGAYLADGSEYKGHYGVSDDTLSEFHDHRLRLLDNSGADVLACETIPSFQEAKVLAKLLNECQTPAWISFSCCDGQHLNDGTDISKAASLFEGHSNVLAIGINCTAPKFVSELIMHIKSVVTAKPVIVYPNSGEIYDAANKSWQSTNDPFILTQLVQSWYEQGAQIIGGCCRIGPAQISSIKKAFKA